MANVVEAILRSRYIDGVSKGVEQTKGLLERDMQSMQNASNLFSSGFGGAMALVQQHLGRYQSRLTEAARTSTNQFAAMGLGAAAMALGIGGALIFAIKRSVDWGLQLVKESSNVSELRLAYESLTATRGKDADMLEKLKAATEGQIGTSALLKNANKVLQSDLAITSAQYAELVQNVFNLAESAGTDQKQAIDTLTDSLIKGTARGLQPMIGVQLSVRDAVNETARAMGVQTSKFDEHAKRQVFYKELLEGTRQAVAALPVSFMSLDDAIERTSVQWDEMFKRVGEGIAKSRVAQELLVRLSKAMEGVGGNASDIDRIALATNRFFVALLRFAAQAMEVLSALSVVFDALWGSFTASVDLVLAAASALTSGVLSGLTLLAEGWGKLPGPVGSAARQVADELRLLRDQSMSSMKEFAGGVTKAFDGLGANAKRLDPLAQQTRKLADEMALLAEQTIHGAAGVKRVGDGAAAAAVDQAKLNEQMKAFRDLMSSMEGRDLSPSDAAVQKLADDMRKINELKLDATPNAEDKRLQLRIAAREAYSRALAKIWEDEAQRESELGEKWILFILRAGEERRKMKAKALEPEDDTFQRTAREQREAALQMMEELERRAKAMRERRHAEGDGRDPWLDDIIALKDALEKLNQTDLSPFREMMQQFKADISTIGAGITEAWGSFISDLVTGQENAGRKFLAAVINMFAKELLILAIRHTMLAISHAAALDFAGAARHAAAAAALGAGAGLLTGISSSLAGTSSGSAAGTTFQQGAARPVSSATQVVQIGRPGGFVGNEQAAGGRLEVVIRMPPGMVATEQARNARANNQQVRLVTENAVY